MSSLKYIIISRVFVLVATTLRLAKGDPQHGDHCPSLEDLPHGQIECTNGSKHGSVCDFMCVDPHYEIHHAENNPLTCLSTGNWSSDERPCCALPCPPYALFDLIVLLHGTHNDTFRIAMEIRSFSRGFLIVSNESVIGARAEFSGDVHLERSFTFNDLHENPGIFFGDSLNHNTADGQTNIGLALTWAFNNLRGAESGNRQEVPDIVVIVTDSSSDDDVIEPALAWRDEGALVYVQSLPDEDGNHPNYGQMLNITGSPEYVFEYQGDAESLAEATIESQLNHICENACVHVLHEHD